jgi:HK97 family phage major capsid protein
MKKSITALAAVIGLAITTAAHAVEVVAEKTVEVGYSLAATASDMVFTYMASIGAVLFDSDATITAAEIKALADKQTELLSTTKELKGWMEKANGEIDTAKSLSSETKAALEKLSAKATELTDKCLELEQKMSAKNDVGNQPQESLGEMFVKSDGWKAAVERRGGTARMEIKTAIVNATGQNQPLVQDMRVPGIITNPDRRLTIRDVLPTGRTNSNLVQFTRELVFTNNAGPQYASPARENVTKPESGITFQLANAPVITLAHWIPVSKQVLDDAPQLQGYINGRLMYGLKLEEEDQLLNGDGTGSNISGILDSGNYTVYNRGQSGDTNVDTIRRAITQAALSEYNADTIILNPADWEEIELQKGTDGHYIWANPALAAGPQLWGRRVIATNSISSGTFLVGAFAMGAQIWDRQDASLLISFENDTNFVKNMATLLVEERLALTVYRPSAFVGGSF